MYLVDANVLLYAVFTNFDQHKIAANWLNNQLNLENNKLAIPWESYIAFIRISCNPRLFSKSLSIKEAWKQVEEWQSLSTVWTPVPTDNHSSIMSKMVKLCSLPSGIIHDAHLAALAKSYGLSIASFDKDFSRFEKEVGFFDLSQNL